MRLTHLSVFVLGLATLLTGCASAPRQSLTPVVVDPIIEAQQALANGNLQQADTILGSAPTRLEDRDPQERTRVLLLAELALRRDEGVEAMRLAELVRSVDPDHPQAAEILGKVDLIQGRFTDAAHMFESAGIFYTLDNDRQRASDLLRLANGLAAYSEGDVAQARASWNSVQSPALRAQFEHAYSSVVGAQSN